MCFRDLWRKDEGPVFVSLAQSVCSYTARAVNLLTNTASSVKVKLMCEIKPREMTPAEPYDVIEPHIVICQWAALVVSCSFIETAA